MPKLAIDIEARFAQAMDALDSLGRKADTQARLMTNAFKGVGTVLGAAFGAVSLAAIERVADSIAAYQDLADQIGDTAEAMSSLQSASDLSGVSLDEVARASARMTSTFSKGGTEARYSAEALAAINIQFEEFRRLSPVEQMERVALELAKFQDGAGKTAVAMQLFGRAGAQLIPFFNDLAEAGGRTARLTAEQIEAADKFTKELARMRSEMSLVTQSVMADLLPAFNTLLVRFRELKQSGAGFSGSLAGAVLPSWLQFDVNESIDNLLKKRDELIRKLDDPPLIFRNDKGWEERQRKQIDDVAKDIEKLKKLRDQLLGTAPNMQLPELDDPLAGARKRLDFTVKEGDKNGASPRQTEAQKILESLEKQQEKLADLNIYEQTALDLAKARNKEYSGLTPEIEKQILARAREVQAAADAVKAQEAADRAEKKRQDEEREGFERFLQHVLQVERLADGYKDLGDPTRRYIQQLEEIDKLQQQNKLSSEEATRARDKINDQIASLNPKAEDPLAEMSVYAEQAARNIQDAFADFLFDPFEDGVEGMLENFSKILRRMAAEALASQILDFVKGWASGAFSGGGSSVNTTGTTLRAIEGGADAVYGTAVKSTAAPNVTVNVNGQGPQLSPAEFQRVVGASVRSAMKDVERRNG